MTRLMSVTLTEDAVVNRTKTETRRFGWSSLTPGTDLVLCRKVMGRSRRAPDGTRYTEPLVRLAHVNVLSVTNERLDRITDEAVAREGFTPDSHPDWWNCWEGRTPAEHFIRFFTEHMRCVPAAYVNVIRWEYL